MGILSNRNRDVKQILQNTRDMMELFGIQEKTINTHTEQIKAHDDRLTEIESKLRDLSMPRGRRAYVLSADARQVAEEMDLSVTALYRILRQADLVIPDTDHTTQKQRVGGDLCRVLVLRGV